MIPESLASVVIHAHRGVQPDNSQLDYHDFVAATLELYEITHHATQSFSSLPRSSDPTRDRAEILDPIPIEEKLALVVRTDGCLNRWKKTLPTNLRNANGEHVKDDVAARQATILHLR